MTVEELLKALEGVPPESQVMVMTEDALMHNVMSAQPEKDEDSTWTTVWLKVEEF